MQLSEIPVNNFLINPTHLWLEQWLLITSGSFEEKKYNTMTVAWGSNGIMWNKPFVQVVVRPTRHTYGFMEKYDSFTLCAFPEEYKSALKFMGTKSGRDTDKYAETGLTPIQSDVVKSPSFEEAELIIECKKIYFDDFEPDNFIDSSIQKNYPINDFHRIYFGEIVALRGIDKFKEKKPA
jgi:flavin reductase (DIM6/NTAB) family NADH-FMN oxidoreductase RutF